MTILTPRFFDANKTAVLLPYPSLFDALESVLLSPSVHVPARNIHNTVGANRFFVMPAFDKEVCITKLISHVPENPLLGLPAIVGQVVVFDTKTGLCRLVLDGPTVTARHAESLGYAAQALPEVSNIESFDLIITCTPAQEAVMHSRPQSNAIVCAIGSYTPKMLEWHPDLIRWIAASGQVVVDSRDADHEAGDLIQATLNPADYPCLEDLVKKTAAINLDPAQGPILFKSCGWGGWDLAAARCALRQLV